MKAAFRMQAWPVVIAVAVLFVFSACSNKKEDANSMVRPNIVFIIADDLGWADVGFHGGNVQTPNLGKLLAEGVELRQHYVAPVCSPTRAGFIAGRRLDGFFCQL